LIGLLAAVGTAIGVLVAVVGLPYGRLNYTAFAGLYHNGGTPSAGFHLAVDCIVDGPVDAACTYPDTAGPVDVGITVGNNTGVANDVGAFNWNVATDETYLVPVLGSGAGLNANPDFYETDMTTTGWACDPPASVSDTNGAVAGPGSADSFISCFDGSAPFAPFAAFPADHLTMGVVHYTHPAGAGSVPVDTHDVSIGNGGGVELMSCNPVITNAGECFPATITFSPPPTGTATNTPTATNTATNTPTATATPPGPVIIKIPEPCIGTPTPNCDESDPQQPLVNLWICENGPCANPGEGSLLVYEYATNVSTGDQNGDTIEDGLGAYEFQVEYDNFVIQSVNPCDVVFGTVDILGGSDGVADGEGAARGPVDEDDASSVANPYCADNVEGSPDGTCEVTIVQENRIRFGCVTSGALPPGPTGDMDLAALLLIPHEDLTEDLFPGNDNGVVTVIKDNLCELVDVFGHPTVGSVGGGLTLVCGDLTITVRILEGDLDLDCDVDINDQQLIAFRYGAFFGSLLYSKWFDLEPNTHDLDIDIKDLQKVFGRDGSTCANPIPAQPPIPFF
jgi:hypothetical protein